MKSIRLRENLGIRFTADGCEIHGPRGLKIKDSHGEYREIIRRLFESGIPLEESSALDGRQRAVLQLLSDNKLLRQHEDDYSRDEVWLSHFVTDARQSLKKLAEKKVLIIGCGGTGAIIADHLARAGVKSFVLVDGADLDAPDLNRQWTYTISGIGQKKVDLLATHLRVNFGAEVKTFSRQMNTALDFCDLKSESLDLIICAADRPRFVIEKLILEFASETNVPVLFGAVGITDDYVGMVLDSPKKLEEERSRLNRDEEMGLSAKTAQGSLCFTNTIAAAKIGLAAYRFLIS